CTPALRTAPLYGKVGFRLYGIHGLPKRPILNSQHEPNIGRDSLVRRSFFHLLPTFGRIVAYKFGDHTSRQGLRDSDAKCVPTLQWPGARKPSEKVSSVLPSLALNLVPKNCTRGHSVPARVLLSQIGNKFQQRDILSLMISEHPACGTCRKKCRKCDRARPVCNRCKSKGLHCEGYPPRFQFCESLQTPSLITAGEERDPEAEQERVQPDVLPTNELTPAQNLSSPTSTPNSLSSDQPSQSRRLLQTLSQGASPASPQDRSLGAPSPATITGHPVDDLLLTSNSQKLLVYFDRELSHHLTIVVEGVDNPFRVHVLPLAYNHTGVLHAVLGLTACHLHLSPSGANQVDMATALQHRVAALNGLSSLLIKEEIYGLTEAEEEAALAIIFLLVLHDVSSMTHFKFPHSTSLVG
ncbi:hypothetical protein CSIM01_12785, partial [Colletotrichum simmondsii]